MRRTLWALGLGTLFVGLGAGPAAACGGLIGRNGTVSLVRTTTLAAYHDGLEHYVTSFQFAGAGGAFGSIVPLPGVPTDVVRGGDWTLQRLVREVTPIQASARDGTVETLAAAPAEVLLKTRVDALDLTVLRGGAQAVGEWAAQNGFLLPPDAPEVLDFYARRSPIFLAASFDADAARRQGVALGDGTPVHITVPTANPWVPLRILGLGRRAVERIDADVFLLTDRRPALLQDPSPGLSLERQGPATESLLSDLRGDKGMGWVPDGMWLSHLGVSASPAQLRYDLAVDATGSDRPSAVAAGLPAGSLPAVLRVGSGGGAGWPLVAAVAIAVGTVVAGGVVGRLVVTRRRRRPAA